MGDYDAHSDKPDEPEKPAGPVGGVGGKMDGKPFCNAPHPTREDVWCRRWPGHEDRDDYGHGAFIRSIIRPEYWEV